MSSSTAAADCVFEPQHYRPNVCKSCFCAKSVHSKFGTPAAAPSADPPRASSSNGSNTSSSPFKRHPIIAAAKITPATTSTPQLDVSQASWKTPVVPAALPVTAAATSSSSAEQKSDFIEDAASAAQEHKEKVEDENRNSNEDDGNDEEDEKLHIVPEDAEQEAWDTVPQAPSISIPPAPAPSRSNRSQSVSVTSSSSSRSPPSMVDVRSSLLNSIQSGTTLRRASEQRPLAEKPLAMDINSELTWTLKKKKKLEEEAKMKELGTSTLGTLLPEEKDEFQRFGQRLTHLGISYSHPATLDSVREFVADLQSFSVRNAATLPLIRAGSSASSVSASSPSSPAPTSAASIASSSNAAASLLGNIDFESVESSIAWPTVRFNCILDTLKLLDRIAVCETHVSKYTTAFEKYKREKEAVEQKVARGAVAPANSVLLNGKAAPTVSMDCFIIDAQIVCQALENLLNAIKAFNDFKQKSQNEDIIHIIDPLPADALAEEANNASLRELSTLYAIRHAQQMAIGMLEFVFEKSRLAYQSSAAASPVLNTDASSSSSERIKSNLVPHYSQTSKAIKNYQALELTLSLYQRMLGARFQAALVPLPLEIREAADELIQLKNDIEMSEAYKTCIAVVQRKGQWDKKEEVQLRRLSRNMSFESPSSSSSSTVGSPSNGRRESLTVAASAVAGANTLRSMKESYPRLFALLENATQDESWIKEFSKALEDLVTKQVPISLVTLFTLRHVVPAHNSMAFRLVLSHVFIPHHWQLSKQEFSESKLKAIQEFQDACVGILHECAAKGFRDGVAMCIAPLSSPAASSEATGGLDDEENSHPSNQVVGLGVDPNARLSTSSSYTLGGANTAMHLAASYSHVAVMAMLLRAGANPLVINSFERTPLFHLHQLFQHNSKQSESNESSSAAASSSMSFLSRYFNNNRLADVRLRIEDEATGRVVVFPAHKLVLCGQSEVFRAMLEEGSSQWASPAVNHTVAESDSLDAEEAPVDPSSALPLIPVPDVPSAASFQLFLQALYTGTLVFTNDDLNAAAGVLTLSSRFLTDIIRTIAARHLAKKVHATNAEGIYNLAKLTNEVSLKHQVEAFIIENYSEALSSELQLSSSNDAAAADSAHPHAFLLRVLEGMDVDALKQVAQAKKPNWHV